MALDVENTEIAFRAKSDAALRHAHRIYALLNNQLLGKMGESLVKLSLLMRLPVEPIIRSTVFRQFCGGETMNQCLPVAEDLARFHIGTVLDYSVEAEHTEKGFDATTAEIIRTVEFARRNPHVAFCVFKVSGLASVELLEKKSKGTLTAAEDDQWRKVHSRVLSICTAAHEGNIRIFVDAEESWIQPAIDELAEQMMGLFNKKMALVYNTAQMYRHDRPEFLRRSLALAVKDGYQLGIKLVRGAYMEKERARAKEKGQVSPICETKAATDQAYDEALAFCAENFSQISLVAGTHNEHSTLALAQIVDKKQLSRKDPRVFFSQLYGMGDHLTYNLAAEGFNTAKYVPYGPVRSVMPYLFRRAEENTSIQGQTSRELGLINRELNRRRQNR